MATLKIQPREYRSRQTTVRAAKVEANEQGQNGDEIRFKAKQGEIRGKVGDFIVWRENGDAEFWTAERFAAEYDVDTAPDPLTLEVDNG